MTTMNTTELAEDFLKTQSPIGSYPNVVEFVKKKAEEFASTNSLDKGMPAVRFISWLNSTGGAEELHAEIQKGREAVRAARRAK
jgi:hypothetical protein